MLTAILTGLLRASLNFQRLQRLTQSLSSTADRVYMCIICYSNTRMLQGEVLLACTCDCNAVCELVLLL